MLERHRPITEPYWWLPYQTSWGEDIRCQNCARFEECDPAHEKYDWLCGSWKEADEVQIQLDVKGGKR